MNAHDKALAENGDLARIRYGDGELTLLRPGRFVLCAVTGKRGSEAGTASNARK